MNLRTVTLTGADDSTSIDKLWELSQEFPFVEWGILLSRNSAGRHRFPSIRWLKDLSETHFVREATPIQLSGHLCGSFVREILKGDMRFVEEIGGTFDCFDRIQINTHGVPHEFQEPDMVSALYYCSHDFIFQYDNANKQILDAAVAGDVRANALFDVSHGAGLLPDQWPSPIPNVYCGYAGGLSSENVEDQLGIIGEMVGDTPFWIDMETKVRSNDDSIFDLDKCYDVLSKCAKYINQ